MSTNRPGRTLAVALPTSFPRRLEFALWVVFITLCLIPLWYFVGALRTNTVGKNNGLLESLSGLLGIVLLIRLVRVTILQILAGRIVVEVSRNPALVGERLDYLLQSKGRMEATLLCTQTKGRHNVVTLVEEPLECGGVRTLTVPDLPPDTVPSDLKPVCWKIGVTVRFGRRFVLEEDYAIQVTEEPSSDRTSG